MSGLLLSYLTAITFLIHLALGALALLMISHLVGGVPGRLVRRPLEASLTIIIGHILNILAFIIAGLLPATQMTATIFSVGLLLEIVIDVIVISAVVPLLRPLLKQLAVA